MKASTTTFETDRDQQPRVTVVGPRVPLDVLLAFSFGVVFCSVLAYAGLRERPIVDPGQFFFLRVLAALCAGGVGAILPGFLSLDVRWLKNSLRAGGALAAFALVFLFNPPGLVNAAATDANQWGYRVDETTLIFDLRARQAQDPSSPVTMRRFDTVVREAGWEEDFVLRSGTSGTRLEAVSLSHPGSAVFARLEADSIIRTQLDKVYQLTIPHSRFPPGEPVEVRTEYRYYGAFQDEDQDWVGYQSRYPTSLVSLIALFPDAKPWRSARVMVKSPENSRVVELRDTVHAPEGHSMLHAAIRDVPPGNGYAVEFHW